MINLSELMKIKKEKIIYNLIIIFFMTEGMMVNCHHIQDRIFMKFNGRLLILTIIDK